MDNFGKEYPAFNIGGGTRHVTTFGGIISALILTVTFLYATIKMTQLVDPNPVMTELTIPGYYSSLDQFYLNQNGFKMAFAVQGYLDKINRNKEEYVKWIVRLVG